MFDVTRYPRLLRAWALLERARALIERQRSGAQRVATHRLRFYERIWREAAAALEARLSVVDGELLEIVCGAQRTRVADNTTALDDPLTLLVAGNKPLSFRLLAAAGLPTPRHAEFSLGDLSKAMAFLAAVDGPCVVKPAKNTGAGQGVTTGVRCRRELAYAAVRAAAAGNRLLIEQQVEGANFRLLYLDGQLLDAVERRPPTVVGDGRQTIAALVRSANQARNELGESVGQAVLQCDLEMRQTLIRQGLRWGSVPRAGETVVVKNAVNENSALDNVSALARVCAEVVDAGARAARALGARLAGVDLIATDIARPLEQTGGVILEVNTTPGLYYHYRQQGGPRPVAESILRTLLGLPEPVTGEAPATRALAGAASE